MGLHFFNFLNGSSFVKTSYFLLFINNVYLYLGRRKCKKAVSARFRPFRNTKDYSVAACQNKKFISQWWCWHERKCSCCYMSCTWSEFRLVIPSFINIKYLVNWWRKSILREQSNQCLLPVECLSRLKTRIFFICSNSSQSQSLHDFFYKITYVRTFTIEHLSIFETRFYNLFLSSTITGESQLIRQIWWIPLEKNWI